MSKKNAPSLQPQTHFELVPLDVVVKIAAIDKPLELTLVKPNVHPSPPESPPRSKK